MTRTWQEFREDLHRRAVYRNTLRELRALPMDVRIDLDIAGIEDRVAREAVWH